MDRKPGLPRYITVDTFDRGTPLTELPKLLELVHDWGSDVQTRVKAYVLYVIACLTTLGIGTVAFRSAI